MAFLSQYFDKRAPTPSVKVAFFGQSRPAKWQKTSTAHGTLKGKIKLKKYSREEYDSVSMVQCQLLYELWKQAWLIKSKKTPESSRALEARLTMLEAKMYISSNGSLFPDERPKANNRNNPALDRKERSCKGP